MTTLARRSMLHLLGVAWLGSGCASTPDAPPPVTVDHEPEIVRHEIPADAISPAPTPRAPNLPAPPPVAGAAEISWSPERPLQASAMVISVRSSGRAVAETSAMASIGERSFRLVRQGDRWIGVAALPLDGSGWIPVLVRIPAAGETLEETRLVRVRPRQYDSQRLRVAARGETEPETEARIRREREMIRSALGGFTVRWLADGGFEWPRPYAPTSSFGQQRLFNGEIRSRHLGLDLRGRRGEPIRAPANGVVALTGSFFYQGNAVYIDHGLGVFSGLFHMSRVDVEPGERVTRGQVIGRVGSTGRSTAPHLHWSAYVGGENVDPASLIQFGPVASAASGDGLSTDGGSR